MQNRIDRLPPQDLDAEKGVLGSVLIDPRRIDDVADVIKPGDFYAEAHQKLFATMLAMHNARRQIDATLLLNQLRSAGVLDEIGGAAYLAEVLHNVPYASNAVYYAKIIKAIAIRRGIIYACSATIEEAYDSTDESDALLDRAENRLQKLSRGDGDDLASAGQLALEALDRVDAITERGKHLGVPTGLVKFDERFGGLFCGELIVLAARPSVGKSALASQIASYVASTGRLVYFASLEMSGCELAMRSVCSIAEVNGQAMRTGTITDSDRSRFVEGATTYSRHALCVDRRSDLTVEAIGRTIRRLLPKGLSLVVIDYLGLLTPSDAKVKRYEQVSQQTRALKLLAREVKVPLLLLCQLNRDAADPTNPPQLHHLRESGSVEQDSDAVLFIHRPEGGILRPDPSDKSKRQKIKVDWPAELIVAKHRNGPTGTLCLDWEPEYTRFTCWGCHRVEGIERPSGYDPTFDGVD